MSSSVLRFDTEKFMFFFSLAGLQKCREICKFFICLRIFAFYVAAAAAPLEIEPETKPTTRNDSQTGPDRAFSLEESKRELTKSRIDMLRATSSKSRARVVSKSSGREQKERERRVFIRRVDDSRRLKATFKRPSPTICVIFKTWTWRMPLNYLSQWI